MASNIILNYFEFDDLNMSRYEMDDLKLMQYVKMQKAIDDFKDLDTTCEREFPQINTPEYIKLSNQLSVSLDHNYVLFYTWSFISS